MKTRTQTYRADDVADEVASRWYEKPPRARDEATLATVLESALREAYEHGRWNAIEDACRRLGSVLRDA